MADKNSSPDKQTSNLDLKEITQIVDLMAKNDITFFQLERQDASIQLRRGHDLGRPEGPARQAARAATAGDLWWRCPNSGGSSPSPGTHDDLDRPNPGTICRRRPHDQLAYGRHLLPLFRSRRKSLHQHRRRDRR